MLATHNAAMGLIMSFLKRVYEIMGFVVDVFIILERTSRDRAIDSSSYPSSDIDLSGDNEWGND